MHPWRPIPPDSSHPRGYTWFKNNVYVHPASFWQLLLQAPMNAAYLQPSWIDLPGLSTFMCIRTTLLYLLYSTSATTPVRTCQDHTALRLQASLAGRAGRLRINFSLFVLSLFLSRYARWPALAGQRDVALRTCTNMRFRTLCVFVVNARESATRQKWPLEQANSAVSCTTSNVNVVNSVIYSFPRTAGGMPHSSRVLTEPAE